MKVIIYNGQKKFTVDNISIPHKMSVAELLKNGKEYTVSASDLKQYNFQITSTRGAIAEVEDEDFIMNEELEREVEEGINWKLESVN
jgi:predicted transcriptional regulator